MTWARRWLAFSSRGWVLVGLGIAGLLMAWRFDVRSSLYAPPSGTTLELAFWPSVFAGHVDQWGPEKARQFLRTLLELHFVFPFVYASFLRGLYLWLSLSLKAQVSRRLARLPLFAGGLHVLVSVLLMCLVGQALAGDTGKNFGIAVLAMSVCAALKWALLAITVLGILAVLLRSDIGWATWTCRFGVFSVLLGSLPLSSSAQGLDLLRVVADDSMSNRQAVVTYLALLLWAVSVWYWCRTLLSIRRRNDAPAAASEPRSGMREVVAWLPRALGTATLLLAALGFWRASAGIAEPLRSRLTWHVVYCLTLALAFFLFVKLRRRLFGWPADPIRVESWGRLPFTTRLLAYATLALSGGFFALFTFVAVPVGPWLGAPAIVFLAASNAVFFGTFSVLLSRALSLPFVVFSLMAAALFSRWNDNHALRLLAGPAPSPRPELLAAFDAWARPRLDEWRAQGKTGRMPAFLAAAEGGGVRAAYWTAVVLGRLQDQRPDFARHVFGISGVSGGSLGASVFVALLHDRLPGEACREFARTQEHTVRLDRLGAAEVCAQEVLRQDFLAPVLAKLLAPDFLQWFLPVPVPVFDRSRAMEDSWSAAYERVTGRKTLDRPFLDVSKCEGAGCGGASALAYPALFLNGTHVHTGQRLLRAPLAWPNRLSENPASDELPQINDLTSLLQADVRLATAAHDSARFAYVSPAGRLLSATGRDFGHVVDGGYFENSGAVTLIDVLSVLKRSELAAQVDFLVVYLCNDPDRCFGATVGSDPAQVEKQAPDLAELFSPVRALLGARDARGSLAIAQSKQFLLRSFLEFGVCPVENEPPVPLGWQLSEGMRARLSAQAAGNGAPGNRASEACVKEALEGGSGPRTCNPAFTPRDGCPTGPPPTLPMAALP